jgi:PTS system galactitol-specific IIB component
MARPARKALMAAKRILVVCGTGVATSTMIAAKVREFCTGKGIDAEVSQTKVMETLRGVEGYDLVVSTTQLPPAVTVPVVSGLPFLTGVGLDQALDDVAGKLGA